MKAFVLLANGFEDIETLTPIDMLRRAGADVKLLSIYDELTVTSAHDVKITADGLLKDFKDETADLVFTPGGLPGSEFLRDSAMVRELLKRQNDAGRFIASICAAPIALDKANVLENHLFTCYPGFEGAIGSGTHQSQRVVVDGNLITGMGPGASFEFGLKIVEVTMGGSAAKQLKSDMLIL